MSANKAQSAVQIKMIGKEEKLLASIELDALALKGYDHAQKNADTVCALMTSLIGRKAIPETRVRYFADPDYNAAGRSRSVQEIFKRNGNKSNEEIFRHPHFLAHLRYFIYGPQLPTPTIEAFQELVESCGPVTSSDVVPLAKRARQLARELKLEARFAADEFYKLALECGLSLMYASAIRDSVKKMR